MRRIDTCQGCGDPRVQIVSKGRCAKCLMKERREAERRGEAVHNPAEFTYLRELNKYLSRFVKAVTALEDGQIPDIFISASDHQTVRRIIREAIDRIQAEKKANEHKSVIALEPLPAQPDQQDVLDDYEDDGSKLTIVSPTSETLAAKPNQEEGEKS